MNINAIIIDDTISDCAQLKELLNCAASELGCEFKAVMYNSPQSAVNALNSIGASHTILFVDVMMPCISGTELVPMLREKSSDKVLFVLMSSQHGYMKEGYAVEAFDFICKPFSKEDVSSVLQRSLRRFQRCSAGALDFYADKTNYRIEYSEIAMIVVTRNYATVFTSESRYCFRSTVKELMAKLPEQFIQVSGNTIVNITRVTSISPKQAIMRKDGLRADIAKPYFDKLLDAFKSSN